jgi:hypothetical protein
VLQSPKPPQHGRSPGAGAGAARFVDEAPSSPDRAGPPPYHDSSPPRDQDSSPPRDQYADAGLARLAALHARRAATRAQRVRVRGWRAFGQAARALRAEVAARRRSAPRPAPPPAPAAPPPRRRRARAFVLIGHAASFTPY